MLIVIVVLFGTLWLPYRIVVVYNSFQDSLLQFKDSWFWLFCRNMVFINSAINPIVYNMLSVKFRRAFRDIVCKADNLAKREPSTSLDTKTRHVDEWPYCSTGTIPLDQKLHAVVRMLIVIVVLFGTLWLPYRIVVVYNSFQDSLLQFKDSWFWLFCRNMVFINSAINPIVYNMLSVKFRRAFRDIVCKADNLAKREPSTSLDTKTSSRFGLVGPKLYIELYEFGESLSSDDYKK
uniref:Thyrotropin-releasing hormone receptor n=1 Tax=Magallana gigas TaxID=29159 RepID=K1QRF6_MAGGI